VRLALFNAVQRHLSPRAVSEVCSRGPLPIEASTGDRWRSAESAEAKITLAKSTARNSDGIDDGKERLPRKINALLQAFTTAIDD
jgi:hypothetical protein